MSNVLPDMAAIDQQFFFIDLQKIRFDNFPH